jgi:hypothetical protein
MKIDRHVLLAFLVLSLPLTRLLAGIDEPKILKTITEFEHDPEPLLQCFSEIERDTSAPLSVRLDLFTRILAKLEAYRTSHAEPTGTVQLSISPFYNRDDPSAVAAYEKQVKANSELSAAKLKHRLIVDAQASIVRFINSCRSQAEGDPKIIHALIAKYSKNENAAKSISEQIDKESAERCKRLNIPDPAKKPAKTRDK